MIESRAKASQDQIDSEGYLTFSRSPDANDRRHRYLHAWQQWQGNKLKLKMDRYERRLSVYQEVVKMLKIGSNGKPEWAEIIDFSGQTAEGDFLFGPEIREYLNDIVTRATKLRSAHFESRDINRPGPVPAHYDHNKVVEEMEPNSSGLPSDH
jgi:hypothetical protein